MENQQNHFKAKKASSTQALSGEREKGTFFLFIFLALAWGIYLYSKGKGISIPFIFDDETTYFGFGRIFFHGENIDSYTHFGPLYSFIIAPLFIFEKVFTTYKLVRILNILVFISAVIPGYLLAKELFNNRWLKLLLPICLLLTPFSGFVYLVWAEPLYFALFYWASYFFYQQIKAPKITTSILLALFLASLYYTKPAAGLVVQIAASLTLAMNFFLEKPRCSEKLFHHCFTILLCFAIDLPWIFHYLLLGVSAIGYPDATSSLAWRMEHDGYTTLILQFIRSLFYQCSYVFIGTWGLIGVGLWILIRSAHQLTLTVRYLFLFSVLSIAGLIAVSAIGMTGYTSLNYKMVQGRYYCVLFPIIITLILQMLSQISLQKIQERYSLIMVFLLTLLLAIIATPLYTLSPLAYNSMPELSAIIYVMDHGDIVWRAHVAEPNMILRILVPITMGAIGFGILLLFFYKRKNTMLFASSIIFLVMGFSASTEVHNMTKLGDAERGLDRIYQYWDNTKFNETQMAFDKKLMESNVRFLNIFWTGKFPIYRTTEQILNSKKSHAIKYFVTKSELPFHRLLTSGDFKIYVLVEKKDE